MTGDRYKRWVRGISSPPLTREDVTCLKRSNWSPGVMGIRGVKTLDRGLLMVIDNVSVSGWWGGCRGLGNEGGGLLKVMEWGSVETLLRG